MCLYFPFATCVRNGKPWTMTCGFRASFASVWTAVAISPGRDVGGVTVGRKSQGPPRIASTMRTQMVRVIRERRNAATARD